MQGKTMTPITAKIKLLRIRALHRWLKNSDNKYVVLKVENQLGKEFGALRVKKEDFISFLHSQRAKIVAERDK